MLAALLGMSPENLSRAFAKLSAQGVTVDGPVVRLSRVQALERLARPSPLIDNHFAQDRSQLGKANTERQQGVLNEHNNR